MSKFNILNTPPPPYTATHSTMPSVELIYILTVPRIFCEASKNVVSAFDNGNRGSFVVTSGVKGLSCETILRSSEQKRPFAV